MRITLLVTFMMLFSGLANGQSEQDFEAFGENVFLYFTDTTVVKGVEFLRINTMHEMIDQQPISSREKADRNRKAENEYHSLYQHYERETNHLLKEYHKENQLGTEFEMLDFSYQKVPGTVNIYNGTLRFLYKSSTVQNVVEFRFRFFYNGLGFILTGPVQEEF